MFVPCLLVNPFTEMKLICKGFFRLHCYAAFIRMIVVSGRIGARPPAAAGDIQIKKYWYFS